MSPEPPVEVDTGGDELADAQAHIAALTAELAALRAHRAGGEVAWDEREGPTRLRNMLATIRSVFRRTVETAGSLDDLALHFTGRFNALVRFGTSTMTQRGVELEDIIRDELLSAGESDGSRTELVGPPVHLDYRQAPLIGLAIHELVTNAIKFGALTADGASLSISWKVEENGQRLLRLTWIESNVPVIASAPMRSGFGREFLEQALPYQLKAETKFELRPGGVRCEILLPRHGEL